MHMEDMMEQFCLSTLTSAERYVLLSMLELIKPDLTYCLRILDFEGLSAIAKHSRQVCVVDFNQDKIDELSNIENVVCEDAMHLSDLIQAANDGSTLLPQFIVINGMERHIKQDVEAVLALKPEQPIHILIYNSFNPICRNEIMKIKWEDHVHVHTVELDYTQGVFYDKGELAKQMWGGFALITLKPEIRGGELIISQSNKQLFDIAYKASVHMEPFHPAKILMNVSRESVLKAITGKKIIFFGTGSASQKIKSGFPFSVDYFVDNDSKKWGNLLNGIEIKSPQALLDENKDKLAILITSQFAEEISVQLVKMGFVEFSHYWDAYSIFTLNQSIVKRYFYDKYVQNDALEDMQYKVSVIVPNYNYSGYLAERINSIVNQTYRPFEIIFLDDASTDDSVSVAKSLLKEANIPYQVIVNNVNNGCFRQWIKGIDLAQGDIIWIAEADDLCRLDFLEHTLAPFADLEVNVSYSQSKVIDGKSNIMGFDYIQYTDDLSRTKWKTNYCQYGQDEVVQGLAIKNTIPNASGVLLRKSALGEIGKKLEQFIICGDWLAYLYALRQGKIAFCSEALNYHRRHGSSIICRQARSSLYFEELGRIKAFIADNYLLPQSMHRQFFDYVESEFERLNCSQTIAVSRGRLQQIKKLVQQKLALQLQKFSFLSKRKRILFVILHLQIGGAEVFPIRLANYLAAFCDVYIYCARPFHTDPQVLKMISSNVYQLPSNGDPNELALFINKYDIQIVNSHAWWADKLVYKSICDKPDIKWIISMHGLYEYIDINPDVDVEFNELYEPIMKRVDHLIYAADKNAEVIRSRSPELIGKLHKISNGYNTQKIQPMDKKCITDNKDSFVFGLVSRAIPEKGWEESIQAIIRLNTELHSDHHLVLIGKSDYSAALKEKYCDYTYIHFVDAFTQAFEWLSWVQIFDAGLLPTYFASESMPIAVMEYLSYEKPVIATNIGEIKNMLHHPTGKPAGILLELNQQGKVSLEDLVQAMKSMILNSNDYQEYKKNTQLMIDEYNMSKCADAYYKLFNKC